MSKIRPTSVRLRDPLSEVTRKERRTLLGASAVGIVIAKTGLIPSKISAFGIDFTQADQRSLLFAIAAVIVYFLIAFLIYAGSDYLEWRLAYRHALEDALEERFKSEEEDEGRYLKRREAVQRALSDLRVSSVHWSGLSRPISAVRAVFEFIVPICISIYAIVVLLRTNV